MFKFLADGLAALAKVPVLMLLMVALVMTLFASPAEACGRQAALGSRVAAVTRAALHPFQTFRQHRGFVNPQSYYMTVPMVIPTPMPSEKPQSKPLPPPTKAGDAGDLESRLRVVDGDVQQLKADVKQLKDTNAAAGRVFLFPGANKASSTGPPVASTTAPKACYSTGRVIVGVPLVARTPVYAAPVTVTRSRQVSRSGPPTLFGFLGGCVGGNCRFR